MMKPGLLFLLLMTALCWPSLVKAQQDALCHYSTEGTDFWFGFMENRKAGDTHYLEITVASRLGANIKVTYGPGEMPLPPFSVPANGTNTLRIPYDLLEPTGSEVVEDKGIHLISDNPVSVYALNYRTKCSDVAVIYPTPSLGNEYYAMCFTPNPTVNIESNNQFMIVATEDNTKVKITPKRDTNLGQSAGQTFEKMLNKGQIYQVQSMDSVITGQGDLTGSHVIADKPIAFYSGAKSTNIPSGDWTRDHLFEQIPPVDTWGREFYVVPLKLRPQDTYRILAAEDETTVRIESTNTTYHLNKGDMEEFELASDQGGRIIADKRVLLTQYCRSQAVDGRNGVGDPFMIIISPVVQKIKDISFVAYESQGIKDMFYVNIVTRSSQVNNIQLDNSNIGHQFKAFPGGLYSYAQVPLTSGQHRLNNDDPDGGFLADVYGFGDRNTDESYGYGVGFNLDIQLDIGGVDHPDTLFICKGESQLLDAGNYFKDYKWSTNETGSSIVVSEEKWYMVTATTSRGCVKTDSVYLKVEDPVVELGPDVELCFPDSKELVATPGFKTYLWNDGSTGQKLVVNKTGEYSVTATTASGCTITDRVNVKVAEAAFTQDYPLATDRYPTISFTNETQYGQSYEWDFGDGATSTEENPKHTYHSLGEYTVTLNATSGFGCSVSVQSTVKIIPFKLLTPNAFRPDSEIEENRIFLPVTEGIDPSNYQLRIYSRTGSAVYESTNPAEGWDGRMPNGHLASAGIYVWTISYSDLQGFNHQDKGTVMLVR